MSEYRLITPPDQIRAETQAYLYRVQRYVSAENRLFVPAAIGAVVAPTGHQVFSTYGVDQGVVYDLSPLPARITSAETVGLLFCGVIFTRLDTFKFLAHAGGPAVAKILTARGLDLIREQAGSLPPTAEVLVCYNPEESLSSYEDLQEYQAGIRDLLKARGLNYRVTPYPVSYNSTIEVY